MLDARSWISKVCAVIESRIPVGCPYFLFLGLCLAGVPVFTVPFLISVGPKGPDTFPFDDPFEPPVG